MDENVVENFKIGDLTVKIVYDKNPEPPNDMCCDEEEGHMFIITTNNRYFCVRPKKWLNVDKNNTEYWSLPLYAYIHSGVALSLSPFYDPWDSGRIGTVYISKSYFTDYITAAQGLVDSWNQYLQGGVYGFEIEDPQGNHIDSCYGFYGDREFVITEATHAANSMKTLSGFFS